ncbi:MAG: hypothetical protein G3M78_13755 [Candidatus Nitrohelix vancouverensis]|uniref:Uncharacterized protein n=1 Tax=Candidatus Nitrohelix vancouverensis TaxID=2705534 RepID=A0A7T0C4K4_9BACT|nr:MAG: hypothetical protein G3M78_13755 [Candidatus Nitrohelix vancouverensis]
MAAQTPTPETIAKILLDEANLAFCETAERKDEKGKRTLEGSGWDEGKMDGEYDQSDYEKILEWQMKAAQICDEKPELEQTTADMFQTVSADNAADIIKQIQEDEHLLGLARGAITVFMLRFPTVQSFVNKGHPLVLAVDEYMLENADAQNWHDYHFIGNEFRWL